MTPDQGELHTHIQGFYTLIFTVRNAVRCVETAAYILMFCVLLIHLYVNFNVNDFSNNMYICLL